MPRRKRKSKDKKGHIRLKKEDSLSVKGDGGIIDRGDLWLQCLKKNPHQKHFVANPVADTPHKDEPQVELDVRRSFTFLNTFDSKRRYCTADMVMLRNGLLDVIVKVLRAHPCLNYYQGYHDIASVIILQCSGYQTEKDGSPFSIDHDKAYAILESLSVNHLRDFMTSTITPLLNHLRLISAILELADPTLFELIRQLSNSYIMSEGTYYDYTLLQALSSMLTLFVHDILDMERISRIWDYFMEYQSMVILAYIYVSALKERKNGIFSQLGGENATDADADLIHTLISPRFLFEGLSDAQFDNILQDASKLYKDFAIDALKKRKSTFDIWFGRFCSSSVLMNTSSYKALNLDDLEGRDITDLDTVMERQNREAIQEADHDSAMQLDAMTREDSPPTKQKTLPTLLRSFFYVCKISGMRPVSFVTKHSKTIPRIYKFGIIVGVAAFAAACIAPGGAMTPIQVLLGRIVRGNRDLLHDCKRAMRDATSLMYRK